MVDYTFLRKLRDEMKKNEFDHLLLSEQISILREHAEYIGSRANAASRLYIYALADFYVELRIGINESNRISFFIRTLYSKADNLAITSQHHIISA